jgi:hypothetical protein
MIAPTDPKAKANAFLDALPGNSAISKTGWVTLAASLGGYAVSNELYVVNEESVILAGFVIMVGYLSTVIKEPYKQWADSVIEVSLLLGLPDHQILRQPVMLIYYCLIDGRLETKKRLECLPNRAHQRRQGTNRLGERDEGCGLGDQDAI